MTEKLTDIIYEYIDFINRQVGVYMDALAGFAGHQTRIERQVHRVNRPKSSHNDKTGQRVVVWASYEDPTKPDVIHNRIIRASEYIAANSPGGSNEQQHSQAIVVFLFAYWEEEIRPRLAALRNVEPDDIQSDIMGDLRILRHIILHEKGIIHLEKHKKLKKLNDMFIVNQPINISYENMHKIFVLIKSDCAKMLNVPNSEHITALAIQKLRKNKS